jgi:hypothetical protein
VYPHVLLFAPVETLFQPPAAGTRLAAAAICPADICAAVMVPA